MSHTLSAQSRAAIKQIIGNDDLAARTLKQYHAADQLTDLVMGWSKTEFGHERGYKNLRKFLDEDLRRDLKNAGQYFQLGAVSELANTNAPEEFAVRFGGTAISLAELPDHLHEFDIVVTGTASTLPILGKGMFERALKARRRRPIFVVDFAVPRDVEPEVSKLEDVFLYTIDDLGRVVSEGRERRQSAAAEAEAIVAAQVRAWSEWQAARGAGPAIVELRRRADQYRETELGKARARLAKGEDPAAVIDALARGLANKFLHHPSQALSRASEGEREQLARAIETLYPDLPERDAGES